MFWPEEKVAAWTAQLFPQGINEMGVERVYNLIILSKDAHDCWNRGAFALKPISMNEDKTTPKIQFFWQKKKTLREQ
jgi:HNH endonuclease